MKTDTYTKSVLTVIAACLVMLVMQNLSIIPTATANPAANPNTITLLPNQAVVPVNPDGSLHVRLSADDVIKVDVIKVAGVDAPEARGRLTVKVNNF